ncbi:MAG: tyrosine-type recombinase/integrase [Acidothermus sp.]|nr:tyrosine-type recombinase/integrase [Acidothermus sp.]
MPRRSSGEGSVFYDARRRRWRGIVTVGHRPDGKPIRREVIRRTRADVVAAMRQLQEEARRGTPAERLTVGEVAERWLSSIAAGHLTAKTVADYTQCLRPFVGALGRKKVDELTADDVENMLATLVDKYSSRRIAAILTIIRRVLRWAERRGYVIRNVATLVDPPKGRPARDREPLSLDEAAALLRAAEGTRWYAAVAFLLATGCRLGELLALRWDDVDLDGGTVHIRRSLRRTPNGGVVEADVKTASSRRVIVVPPWVVEILRQHRRILAAEKLAAGPAYADHNLVFPSELGGFTDPSNFRRAFRRLTKQAGIARSTWPHLLRHSVASWLSDQGVEIAAIADQLGHRDARITAAVYRHRLRPIVDVSAKIPDLRR